MFYKNEKKNSSLVRQTNWSSPKYPKCCHWKFIFWKSFLFVSLFVCFLINLWNHSKWWSCWKLLPALVFTTYICSIYNLVKSGEVYFVRDPSKGFLFFNFFCLCQALVCLAMFRFTFSMGWPPMLIVLPPWPPLHQFRCFGLVSLHLFRSLNIRHKDF